MVQPGSSSGSPSLERSPVGPRPPRPKVQLPSPFASALPASSRSCQDWSFGRSTGFRPPTMLSPAWARQRRHPGSFARTLRLVAALALVATVGRRRRRQPAVTDEQNCGGRGDLRLPGRASGCTRPPSGSARPGCSRAARGRGAAGRRRDAIYPFAARRARDRRSAPRPPPCRSRGSGTDARPRLHPRRWRLRVAVVRDRRRPCSGNDPGGSCADDDRDRRHRCGSLGSRSRRQGHGSHTTFVPAGARSTDTSGHGTFVASIAGGSTSGGAVAGFGGAARLLVVKVGDGTSVSDVDIAAGIVRSVRSGARIVNVSLAGRTRSAVEASAVAYAARHGVLVVAAAGNDALAGNPAEYPAALLQPVGSNGVGGVGLAVAASGMDGRQGEVLGARVVSLAGGAGNDGVRRGRVGGEGSRLSRALTAPGRRSGAVRVRERHLVCGAPGVRGSRARLGGESAAHGAAGRGGARADGERPRQPGLRSSDTACSTSAAAVELALRLAS